MRLGRTFLSSQTCVPVLIPMLCVSIVCNKYLFNKGTSDFFYSHTFASKSKRKRLYGLTSSKLRKLYVFFCISWTVDTSHTMKALTLFSLSLG